MGEYGHTGIIVVGGMYYEALYYSNKNSTKKINYKKL